MFHRRQLSIGRAVGILSLGALIAFAGCASGEIESPSDPDTADSGGDAPHAQDAAKDAKAPRKDAEPSADADSDDAAEDAEAEDAEVDTSVPDDAESDVTVPDTSVPDTAVPDTSVPDTSVPDTSVPDTSLPDTSVPDAAHDAGVDARPDTGPVCGGLPDWVRGTTAQHVKRNGRKYTCLEPGWCSNVSDAYDPGDGWAWQQAWKDDGPCT